MAVFLLVFVSTIPVVVPFMILQDAVVALRISNAIAVAMMFVAGYAFGRAAGYRPWMMAGSMVLLGAFLVALTIALGRLKASDGGLLCRAAIALPDAPCARP